MIGLEFSAQADHQVPPWMDLKIGSTSKDENDLSEIFIIRRKVEMYHSRPPRQDSRPPMNMESEPVI